MRAPSARFRGHRRFWVCQNGSLTYWLKCELFCPVKVVRRSDSLPSRQEQLAVCSCAAAENIVRAHLTSSALNMQEHFPRRRLARFKNSFVPSSITGSFRPVLFNHLIFIFFIFFICMSILHSFLFFSCVRQIRWDPDIFPNSVVLYRIKSFALLFFPVIQFTGNTTIEMTICIRLRR